MTAYTGAQTALLDAAVDTKIPVTFAGGRLRAWSDDKGDVAWAQNDTILLARVPSSARISHLSRIVHEAFGTSVTGDVGLFNQTGNSDFTDDPNALSDGNDISSAGSFFLFAGIDIANTNKRVWELTDATSDFDKEVDILLSLVDANPTDNAHVAWEIVYVED